MTIDEAKAIVKAKYPQAKACDGIPGIIIRSRFMVFDYSDWQRTESDAWIDAAWKIEAAWLATFSKKVVKS